VKASSNEDSYGLLGSRDGGGTLIFHWFGVNVVQIVVI
jgi:hypothetical protein